MKPKKITITITNEDGLIGTMMRKGREVLDWNNLDIQEQHLILNTIASSFNFFRRFLKEYN